MLKIKKQFVQNITKAKQLSSLFPQLQNAIELEHATIPPYLTAMFSLKPGTEMEIRQVIHSIVIEEMMHMTIAANILNALGGKPSINHPGFVPSYPGTLPMGIGSGLMVGLEKYSRDQVKNVFMEIEEPMDPLYFPVKMNLLAEAAVPPAPDYHTIGEFYNALKDQIDKLAPNKLPGNPKRQVTSGFYPQDLLFPILTKKDAMHAIDIIVEQGEGTSTKPVDPEGEIAHYYKFEELYIGKRLVVENDGKSYAFSGADIPYDPANVQPIYPNTKAYMFADGSEERRRVDDFNLSYHSLLDGLHKTFNGRPQGLGDSIGTMYDLKLYAEKLCAMPFPGKPNTNIGPTFEYIQPMLI